VDFDQALEAVLATCRGHLLDVNGSIRLRIDQQRSPLFDFSDHPTAGAGDNIVDGSFTAWHKDTREVANRLELMFRDTENNFAVMTKLWNHEPQQARTGRVIAAKLHLGNMPQHQAERVGNYLLTRAIDNNLYCRFRGTPASLAVMPGDVVRVKHDAAPWSQETFGDGLFQSFEVLEVTELPDETREFLLRVYNPNTYPDTAGPTQNLIGTTVLRRPLPPPQPEVWNLTANLDGELRLSFSIPRSADYRTGDLELLADEELERVVTSPASSFGTGDTSIAVTSSAGFLVGDYVNAGTEILQIVGPGVEDSPPTSNTWQVARGLKGTDPVAGAWILYRLTERRLHFAFPAGYTLAHPTLDLANGEYYRLRFRPGRMRILYGALRITGIGGTTDPLERTFNVVGASEPIVPGTLPGLRVADGGYLLFHVEGGLVEGGNGLVPIEVQGSHSIGIVYAAVEVGPALLPIQLQLKLDDVAFGPVGEIPVPNIPGDPSGSGVFLSGAAKGNVGGQKVSLELLQVGVGEPGQNLRVYLTV
jgi:hypothetical protein